MKCIECGYDINDNESYNTINDNPVHLNGCRARYIRRLDNDSLQIPELDNYVMNE